MSLFQLVSLSEGIPKHVPKLLKHAENYCEQNEWAIALALMKIVLEDLENALESDSRDVGLILSAIGFIKTRAGKYDDAQSFLKRAISVLDKYNRKENLAIKVLRKFVEDFYENCQYEEAESFGKIAIEINEKPYKVDTYMLADLNYFVGKSCLELKKPDEAKEFLQAALPFYTEDSDSPQVTNILKSLEIVYFWRNNIAESKELFENSNEIADVTPLCLLGMLYEDANLPSEAVDYYQRAVKIYESKGSPDDLQLADVSLKLGKCYLKICNFLESKLCLSKSHDIYKKTLADDDPIMLDVKIHRAIWCVKSLQSTKLGEARFIYETILGNVHVDGSGVSILDWARDNKRNEEDKVPILNGKCNAIVPALLNLSALYILGGNYKPAKILQNFAEAQHDLIGKDGN